jgi:hypothetical protein
MRRLLSPPDNNQPKETQQMPFHSDITPHAVTTGPAFWAAFVAIGLMAGRRITHAIRPNTK